MRRSALRLLLYAAAAGLGWFFFVSWADRIDPVDALPAGTGSAARIRDLDGLLGRIEDTRFAAAVAGGALGSWIEASDAVRALDALRLELRAATGIPLERRHWLDLLGRETAVAWNAGADADREPAWVASCRLSTRAWAITRALLLLDRTGILPLGLVRERTAGGVLLALPGENPGHQYHGFLVGRLLVLGNDRPLVHGAARCVREGDLPLAQDPSWAGIRARLPEGDAFLWSRSGTRAAAGLPGLGPVAEGFGAVLRAGAHTEIHLFAEAPAGEGGGPPAAGPPPGTGLLARDPLLLLAGGGMPPAALADLVAERIRRVGALTGAGEASLPGLAPGYLVSVSGVSGQGALPRPEGAIVFTMADDGAAEETVGLLFPPFARTAPVAGTVARSTRESLPLSGELEVWGAALGPRVVLATGTGEIAALAGEGSGAPAALPRTSWEIEAVSAISGSKALPLLRPYRPFLAGWFAARYQGLPNLAQDLELLGALRSAILMTGGDAAGRRALIVLRLEDLPEGAASTGQSRTR